MRLSTNSRDRCPGGVIGPDDPLSRDRNVIVAGEAGTNTNPWRRSPLGWSATRCRCLAQGQLEARIAPTGRGIYEHAMSIYLTRSTTAPVLLVAAKPALDDTLFINQRFDAEVLVDARFTHCTFANISFKSAKLINCYFVDCVFEGCYFRNTEIRESNFPACRFIDSEFVKPIIVESDFGYVRFIRSAIPYDSLESSLPGRANVCYDLTAALAIQAALLGRDADARRYRLKSIEKREEALWRGVRWSDDYARSHYPTDFQRVGALTTLVISKLNGFLWGYGESMRRLLINLLVLSAVLCPLLLLLVEDNLHKSGSVSVGDAWLLSLSSIMNTGSSGITATGLAEAIVLGETALGLLFFGLFVAYLFRAVTRR